MKKALLVAGLLFSSFSYASGHSDRVQVSEMEVVDNAGIPTVTGLAKNISDAPIKHLFVKFKLYRNGEVVGNTIDQASDIDPGESYRFKAPALTEFDEAKLSSVDAY